MKYMFSKTKIITSLIIILSSVNTTFATAKPLHLDRIAPLTNECKQMNIKDQYGLEINFKDIVTGKKITQEQANKIKTVINRDKPVKKSTFERTKIETEQSCKIYKINPFTALVDNGTITQSQADKIILKQIYLQHAKMLKSVL